MQCRGLLLASAAALCLSYTGATAASGHFSGLNAGVDVGWAHVFGQIDDVNPNYANNSGFQDVTAADGFLLGGHLGYDWQFGERWLVGLEAGVQSITTESAGCGAAGCAHGSNGNPHLGYDVNGIGTLRARLGAIMSPRTLLYVGGGLAVAQVQTHHHDNDEFDGQTRTFTGYTLDGGIQYGLSEHADVRLDLAYDHFSSKHWLDPVDENFGAEPEVFTASLGAVWHFNNVREEAPPPPPPPAAAPERPREFIVFFGFNKSNLTAEASRVVHEAAEAAHEYGSATILVVGHTDTSGSQSYNMRLSLRRAAAVKAGLASEGISAGMIQTSGKGETELMVQTGDGVKEPQNRRATISLH